MIRRENEAAAEAAAAASEAKGKKAKKPAAPKKAPVGKDMQRAVLISGAPPL